MKNASASLLTLTLATIALSFRAAPALAGTNTLRTVGTQNNPAQDCAGSVLNQYSNPSAGNICWSGTSASDYVAFSLKAMEAGDEVFPLVIGNTPTLELYNDTGSTTVSLELVGTIGVNDPISCQGGNGSTGCEISGPLGTFGSESSGAGNTAYGPSSTTNSWPAVVTVTFYGVPLNTYIGLQWSSWTSMDQSGIYLGGQPTSGSTIAGSCSLGPANAYNLISLMGNISDAADITGRIAAAGQVTQATTIGSALRTSDPYISLASQNGGPWAIVAGGGIPIGDPFNINGGGNVYSSTPTSATFNFANENFPGSLYPGADLVTGTPSPIDFSTLGINIQSLSAQLSEMPATGAICSVDNSGSMIPGGGCPSDPIYFSPNSQHYNPSWLVLYGTLTTINVFNITQAQFQANNNLDIEVPTGSTVIINVAGTSNTLQTGVYFQGNTVSDANASNILFNFSAANSVVINGQIDATVLAPNADLSGISQMGGVFVAGSIGSTGETHYIPFSGSLPCSSDPAPLLSLTCAAVNTGTVGVVFDSGPMSVTGGTAPFTYSIVGTLPAGLTLNTLTGRVTGTPTASGTFSIQVTDAKGNVSTMTCAINIQPAPLSVSCAAVTTGEVGVAFNSGSMTVSGGTAPYTYSIVGTLPAGLTLNTMTGAITGTPTAAGSFSVKVTDAKGATGTACSITINAALSVNCAAVTTGEVGVAFNSGPVTVTNGTGPYTYSIVGTLPAGLTLNTTTGAITGTPTAAGSFSVKVTDAKGATGTACSITINAALSVSCPAVTSGEVGVVFNSGPMAVTGGTAPYTYSIMGTLPAGLTLNTTTGAITGTPTAAGSFSVRVTDAKGATGTACAITINAAFSISCAAVTTGQVGVAFNSGPMTVTGGTGPYTYSIVGTLPAGLSLNRSTGAITGTPTAAGTFNVQARDANGATGTSCAITISIVTAVGPGDAATIGYWHNNNGQALINEMNGGPNATNLANWLAANFPYLYGSHSSNDLTGKTNSDVAALFMTFFGASGQKTSAQVMAGALAVYVTDPNLAGTNIAGSQGFNISGTGAKTINIGSDGAGAGLANNTFLHRFDAASAGRPGDATERIQRHRVQRYLQ